MSSKIFDITQVLAANETNNFKNDDKLNEIFVKPKTEKLFKS